MKVRTREEAAKQLQRYFVDEALQMWEECYNERVPWGVKTEMGDMKADGLSTAEICYAIWRTSVQESELEGREAWEYVKRIAYNILGRRIDWKGAAL